jgi:branched-subunit amino acid transport protein
VSTGETWALIGLCALVTFVIKAAGPIALGHRELPPWFTRVIALMAPALLAALVVTATLADGQHLGAGADTAGVGVAGIALWRGVNVVVGVAIAAVVTAALRAAGV